MKRQKNERGVTMIEYALLLAVVVMGIVLAFNVSGLKTAISALISRIVTCLGTGPCV